MKHSEKVMAILLSAGIILLADMGTAKAAKTGWYKQSDRWRYRLESGSDATGWVMDRGKWYYMDGSGMMRTGWVFTGSGQSQWYYMANSGAMVTGWQKIKGTWYYFKPSGAMIRNAWVGDYYLQVNGSMAANRWIGKYYVGADGKWIPNYGVGSGNVVESSPSDGNIGIPPEQVPPPVEPVFEEKMVYHESLSHRVFNNINAERAKAGLPPYVWQEKRCNKIARLQSGYNVLRFDPGTMQIGNGSLPFETHYVSDISYLSMRTPEDSANRAVMVWMGSPLHRHCVLSDYDEYCAVAVYSYQDTKGRRWVSIIATMVKADVDMLSNDTNVPQEYWNQILNCKIE